ncbi:MAG: hypothetical protein ACYDHY_01075 [Acidiferrobacterales bacterium]
MSYLDRLKRKIYQDAAGDGATKGTKGAFVPFVAARPAPSGQNLSKEATFQDWRPTDAELSETIHEAFEERAAIREYDGGQSRKLAEAETRGAMRVYEYRLAESPAQWLVVLAPDRDLAVVTQSLQERFGTKQVVEVRPHQRSRNAA